MEKIDPWASSNVKDYDKLARNFGINYINEKHRKILNHYYFKRNIVFGHKGIDVILKAIKEKSLLQ
jgi:hypothetical protein